MLKPDKTTTIFILFFAAFVCFMIWMVSRDQTKMESAPCSSFASEPVKDVPARCLKEFQH